MEIEKSNLQMDSHDDTVSLGVLLSSLSLARDFKFHIAKKETTSAINIFVDTTNAKTRNISWEAFGLDGVVFSDGLLTSSASLLQLV